jgi:hypothetical protein
MGSGKLSKRARHLAKCRNIRAQKIAVYHQVPELSLAELADLKSRHAEEGDSNAGSDNSSSQGDRIAEAHWEGLESDSEYTDEEGYLSEGDFDLSEGEVTGKADCETNTDAFQKMMKTVMNKQTFDKVKFRYQRGLYLGQMQKWRKMKQVNQLRAEVSSSMPLTEDWLLLTADEPPLPPCIENSQSRMEHMMQKRNAAIIDIDKKLNSKKTTISPQTIVR